MGYEIGMDSPETKFDNNTTASTLMAGWVFPTLLAIILFFILKTLNKNKKENASDTGTDAQKDARPF